jgi:hypothetical protein
MGYHAAMFDRAPWLLMLALVACDDDAKRGALPTASPPKEGLLVDDTAVTTHPALAIGTEGETSLRVIIPLAPLSCEALVKSYPERPIGEYVEVWLRRPIEADRRPGVWAVRSAFVQDHREGRGLTTRGAMVEDVVVMAGSQRVKGLELALQDRGRLFTHSGDLEVRDCGRAPRPELDRPQTELKLTVAGEPVAVRGASIRPEGGKLHLRLTRAPHACGSIFTEGYDFYLDLVLDEDPLRLAFAALQGDVFPDDPSGSQGKESFVVKSEEDLRGTGEVDVTLAGELGLGQYRIALDGTAKVLRCTPL